MEVQDIRNLSYQELTAFLKETGEPAFRARQVFDWIYKKGVADFGAMSNLSSALREKLQTQFTLSTLKIIHELTSEDQTKKFLFEMSDGEKVETVLIPTENRGTVCVSTQAGCKFGCKFCASGLGGWTRNLLPGEILVQILHAKSAAKAHPVSHSVFMGTGEPLTTLRYGRLSNSWRRFIFN